MLTNLTRWDPLRDLQSSHLPVLESPGGWFPPVDIVEEGDQIILRAEIPGVSKDDIELKVENGTITLHGEKKDAERIKATYRDGILPVPTMAASASAAASICGRVTS